MSFDAALEILEIDVVTGRRTSLPGVAARALRAISGAEVPHAVIGATALAVRGLPRNTRDLDLVVTVDDAWAALDALEAAGFESAAPVDREADPEAMYVMTSPEGTDVDVLVAAGEPESSIIAEAPEATVFGVRAPVATLEHLLLMYLYSNQLKHLGDFARIVNESDADLPSVERYLADVHPEMLETFRDRVREARAPRPAPPRPTRRRSR